MSSPQAITTLARVPRMLQTVVLALLCVSSAKGAVEVATASELLSELAQATTTNIIITGHMDLRSSRVAGADSSIYGVLDDAARANLQSVRVRPAAESKSFAGNRVADSPLRSSSLRSATTCKVAVAQCDSVWASLR
jgi:hypothetical protein